MRCSLAQRSKKSIDTYLTMERRLRAAGWERERERGKRL